ncbi:MAG: iron-sulfur cluster carrier protein ApbC [Anaerolineae bacterium]|nr:MAG: iron-sulfur cluster carrier protein ApbC [Anaerolineae bacterium]
MLRYVRNDIEGESCVATEESILEALSGVLDPELGKDLVTLGMVKDISIQGTEVAFTVELTTPACPLRDQIEHEAKAAVEKLEGVDQASVSFASNIPSDGRSRGLIDRPIKNAIAVASGKGGVGKSTVAVNLAVALARAGARVGLLDADIYGPNVPTMMGVDRMPPPAEGKLMPAEAFGVKFISIAFMVEPGKPLIWRGPLLHSAIRQFIADVVWGELDYLVIDLPPGTGDAPLSLSQSMPLTGAVIVTMPQQVSLDDAIRALEMFRTMDVPILGVVENMSFLQLESGEVFDLFGQGGGKRLAEAADVPFLGTIPIDPRVRVGGDQGTPIVVSHPDSDVGLALTSVAEQIAAKVSVLDYQRSSVIPIELID